MRRSMYMSKGKNLGEPVSLFVNKDSNLVYLNRELNTFICREQIYTHIHAIPRVACTRAHIIQE